MKIRTELQHDEDEVESISENIKYTHLFLGDCHGIFLQSREHNNKPKGHICFGFLCEDDGHWFEMGHGSSSYWLKEMKELTAYVNDWLEKNAEPDIYKNVQYGYKYKKT